jgi:hypothetical protein
MHRPIFWRRGKCDAAGQCSAGKQRDNVFFHWENSWEEPLRQEI